LSRRAGLLVAALLLAACGQDDKPAPGATPAPTAAGPAPAPQTGKASSAAGDAEKGRQVYIGQCVACHNRDPGKDGPLGPAVKGSPPELVEARVVRGEYPPGYTPKRPSKVMPARPDLASSVPDLAVYLR
jgi:mono/diheme cytochrome c family protein